MTPIEQPSKGEMKMKAGELGMIQEDIVSKLAQRIFELKVSMHKGAKPMNYGKEAEQMLLAAEAFYNAAIASGHINYKGPL